MVVIGSGTGGTVTGVARKLKEKCPECKVSWETVDSNINEYTGKKNVTDKGVGIFFFEMIFLNSLYG